MSNSCQPCCTFAISKKGPKLLSRHPEVGNMGTQSEQQSAECALMVEMVAAEWSQFYTNNITTAGAPLH